MKQILSLLLLFISVSLPTILSCQYHAAGTILDADTELAIPYVNIGVIDLGKGSVSDTLGQFSFEVDDEDVTITASAIGYKTGHISFSKLEETGVLFLERTDYKIETVTISSSKFVGKVKQYGVKNKNRGQSIGFGNGQLGTAIGAVIQIKKPTYIKSANFILNHAKGDSMTFRVNILEYKKKKIGDNLLSENVIVKAKQKKGLLTVDLSHLDLVLESNVLTSLEWIRDDDGKGNNGITFDTKRAGKYRGVYMKFSSLDEYEKSRFTANRTPCFYLMGKSAK